MQQVNIRAKLLSYFVICLFVCNLGLLSISSVVSAEDADQTSSSEPAAGDATDAALPGRAILARQHRLGKLENGRLKACENRQQAIDNILARIAMRGEKHIDVINKISERVQAFYEKKGYNVSNYDTLLATVNSKKSAAEAAVADIKTQSVEFKCDSSDPLGMASVFKTSLKSEIDALKAYKTSVKDLIVAVKSAASMSTDNSTDSEGGDQ